MVSIPQFSVFSFLPTLLNFLRFFSPSFKLWAGFSILNPITIHSTLQSAFTLQLKVMARYLCQRSSSFLPLIHKGDSSLAPITMRLGFRQFSSDKGTYPIISICIKPFPCPQTPTIQSISLPCLPNTNTNNRPPTGRPASHRRRDPRPS